MTVDHSVTEHAGKDGQFRRQTSTFRSFITPGGEFPPEKGRYILYVVLGCPWATRATFTRALKGLEDIIDVAILDYELTDKGWTFKTRTKDATGDPVYGKTLLREIYHIADPNYNLRYTVPVLFDKKTEKIVNNESSEVIRSLYTGFDSLLPDGHPAKGKTYYPESHAKEIDELNEWIYDGINNGVYKAGFASTQEAYNEHVTKVFQAMDRLEEILSDGRKYLVPEIGLSEADIRLMPSLIRFDAAYVTLFKCNLRTIRDGYPNIHRYLRYVYWNTPEFQKWTNFYEIKMGYSTVRNNGIMPIGPDPPILPIEA